MLAAEAAGGNYYFFCFSHCMNFGQVNRNGGIGQGVVTSIDVRPIL